MKRERDQLPKLIVDLVGLEAEPMAMLFKGNASETPTEISLSIPQMAKSRQLLYKLQVNTSERGWTPNNTLVH